MFEQKPVHHLYFLKKKMRERKIMNRIFKNEEIASNVLIVVYLVKCRVLFLSSKRYIKKALRVCVLDR